MPYGQNPNNLITLGNNTAHGVLGFSYTYNKIMLILLLFLLQKILERVTPKQKGYIC